MYSKIFKSTYIRNYEFNSLANKTFIFDCSDECEEDHYEEVTDNHNVRTLGNNYIPSHGVNHRSANIARLECVQHPDYERSRAQSRSTDRNVRNDSVPTSNSVREQSRTNSGQEVKNQVNEVSVLHKLFLNVFIFLSHLYVY